jgi:hypothetical protein
VKLLNFELKKQFILFCIIFLFSSIFFFTKTGSIGLALFVFSILIIPVILIKPNLAFPFITNINRKTGLVIVLVLFIVGAIIAPKDPVKAKTDQINISPTMQAGTVKVSITIVKSNIKEVEAIKKPTVTLIPTKTPMPTIRATNTPLPLPTNTPYIFPTATPIQLPQNTAIPQSSSGYSCNCAKTCPALSCEEAYYQLNNCGCSARDGDNDGIPCEAQCR